LPASRRRLKIIVELLKYLLTVTGIFQQILVKFPNVVKVKVKVKFTLEQATKTQRGSGGIALLFL
jgi:hypothetical protein